MGVSEAHRTPQEAAYPATGRARGAWENAPVSPDATPDTRPIRPAATVIVARPGPRGPEVLVLRRAPRQRFLAGYVVFPGGAVDEEDAALAESLFGSADESFRACGARELVEEAGLAVTSQGVAQGGMDAVKGSPPTVAMLPQVSRWVAPEDVPVRFDARFFAAGCERGVEPVPDGDEAERAWWARPADLLEANASGGCTLYWPTMKVMEGLAACASVEEILAADLPQVEPEVQVL